MGDGLEIRAGIASEKPEDSTIKLAAQAFMHSAIQSPLDGATQLVNQVANQELVPHVQLVDAPRPVEFGSAAWVAETVGSGFGMTVPFMIVSGASRGALAKTGASLGPASKMALDGALYGLTLTPSNDPSRGFWEQRGVAATSSAITFGVMGLANQGIMSAAEGRFGVPVSNLGFRLGANAVGGAIGGFASAESNSLLSGNGLATKEQVGQSMASFMVTGAALEGARMSGEYYRSAVEGARVRAAATAADQVMLEGMQKAHFEYFKKYSDPDTGLTKDRSTDQSPASVAAVGFSLTAHGVAADHGWVTREQAADYTLKVLNTLWSAKQGSEAQGTSGDHGFFYHFLDPKTGTRAGENEISTIDTALLMSGVLFSKNYFNGNTPKETQIRELSDNLYRRVDWNWALTQKGELSMGWTPEHGFIPATWQGYNEAPILLLLGIGSPTHPLPPSTWDTYMSTAKVSENYGQKGLEFGPMFGHQYPQIWLDFRGIRDAVSKKNGFDYFENSRRAVLAQHEYAIHNPQHFRGYGDKDWGLTASDGPGDVTKTVDGKPVQFYSYMARGFPNAPDDGTIAPTAAAASLPFAPEIVLPTLRHWINDRPEIVGPVGFQDAFNPTFEPSKPSGWVDKQTLGIDQGPILLMTENYLTGSIWQRMKADPYLTTGLKEAGFTKQPWHRMWWR
jgi:hypothetical protein